MTNKTTSPIKILKGIWTINTFICGTARANMPKAISDKNDAAITGIVILTDNKKESVNNFTIPIDKFFVMAPAPNGTMS